MCMVVFIVHWPCLLTTKVSCLQKNKSGHANSHLCLQCIFQDKETYCDWIFRFFRRRIEYMSWERQSIPQRGHSKTTWADFCHFLIPSPCVEVGFTWTFPRNQDAKVKLKSELIPINFSNFLIFLLTPSWYVPYKQFY